MNQNRNDDHDRLARDPDVLSYVESKRKIQEALALAQEAERRLDRNFEAKLQEKVAEGQKALTLLNALQSKRITAPPAPQTAPPAVSYPQQQTSGNPSYANADISYPTQAASSSGLYTQYPLNGHNQQFAAQYSGQSMNYATTNVPRGVSRNTPAGPSQSAKAQAAPVRPPAGFQTQAQYSQAPFPTLAGSHQNKGHQMQGNEHRAAQQSVLDQPVLVNFVNGPQSYHALHGGNVPLGVRPNGGYSNGPMTSAPNGGGQPTGQQWQMSYMTNNGTPIIFGAMASNMFNANVQAPQHIQRNASSTLEGALGPNPSTSSNLGPSTTLASKQDGASIGGSNSQDIHPNSNASNQSGANQPQSNPQVQESTQNLSAEAVVVQSDVPDTDIGSAEKHQTTALSAARDAELASGQSQRLRPPRSALGGEFPDMQDLQSRAKVSNTDPRTRTTTPSSEKLPEQTSGPTKQLPNQQSVQVLPTWHAHSVPMQIAPMISGQMPYGADPLTPTQVQGIPFINRRVFVPPAVPASRTERPTTPHREKESTTPVTPASAKKTTLAKDILFALGMGSRKRKSRSEDGIGSASEHEEESARKKLATGTMQPTDDQRDTESMQVESEPTRNGTTGVHSNFIPEPPLSAFANLPSTNDVDSVAAISAGIAQVVSEVQSSVSTPNEFVELEGPTIIELSDEDDVAAFQTVGATIIELPDDESEATVELGLKMTQPEAEVQSRSSSARWSTHPNGTDQGGPTDPPLSTRPSSARMSPIFDPVDDVGPLFLPSPSPEPQPPVRKADNHKSMEAGPSKMRRRRDGKLEVSREVYVEVPPLPKWAGKARSMREYERAVAPEAAPAPSPIPRPAPAPSEAAKEAKTVNEDAEAKVHKYAAMDVMQEAMSRLRHRTCRWPGCTRSFNTAFKLQRHVTDHIEVGLEPTKGLFHCKWEGCENRLFNNDHAFLKHTQNHVARLQQCSVVGCDEEFKQLKDLVAHWEIDHPGERNLRSDDKPFHPTNTPHLSVLPGVIPAYATTVALQCRPSLITKDKHQEIGPRVLKRIFGPVNLNVPRLSARLPLRSAQQQQINVPKRHDEFDFLSSASTRPFSDIPSTFVSDIVEANVLMEPVEGPPQGEFEEVIIASDRIPDEMLDVSKREDDTSAAAAALADSGVDVEDKKNDSGATSGNASGSQQKGDVDRDSESSVDGLV